MALLRYLYFLQRDCYSPLQLLGSYGLRYHSTRIWVKLQCQYGVYRCILIGRTSVNISTSAAYPLICYVLIGKQLSAMSGEHQVRLPGNFITRVTHESCPP